jgi:hypothetical protein
MEQLASPPPPDGEAGPPGAGGPAQLPWRVTVAVLTADAQNASGPAITCLIGEAGQIDAAQRLSPVGERALLRHRVALVRLRTRCATGSTPSSPTTAMTGRPAGAGPARAGPGSPPWHCPQFPASWSRTSWA